MRRGTQTTVTVTTSLQPPIKEFKFEPSKQERVEKDDEDEDEYDEDDNFVLDEAREYGRENVGPVPRPYLMLCTQYGFRKDGDMFMLGDSPIVFDTRGDITIKDRVINPLTPNDHYSGRTAPLTSKRSILYTG